MSWVKAQEFRYLAIWDWILKVRSLGVQEFNGWELEASWLHVGMSWVRLEAFGCCRGAIL